MPHEYHHHASSFLLAGVEAFERDGLVLHGQERELGDGAELRCCRHFLRDLEGAVEVTLRASGCRGDFVLACEGRGPRFAPQSLRLFAHRHRLYRHLREDSQILSVQPGTRLEDTETENNGMRKQRTKRSAGGQE